LTKKTCRSYGTTARRLLVRYLFAHTTVHRIEAATEVDNIAEQRRKQDRSLF
jgi:RimJ/RimL family protein N-acetyltransferase